MQKKVGQTITFENPPVITSFGTVVGPKEGLGPLSSDFDKIEKDLIQGEASFEKAEQKMMRDAAEIALTKLGMDYDNIDYLVSGDLLNQIITSGFFARWKPFSFLGQYGACSTFGQSLAVGCILIDGGFADTVLAGTSSHNSTAERQYRYPTEYGFKKPGTAQWTVTGAGVAVLSKGGSGAVITKATIGKVVDIGVKDVSNLGSAMALGAADTLLTHFVDTETSPQDYDLILTGDLGAVGKSLTEQIVAENGIDISANYTDCGVQLYYPHQQVSAGGSGCGCSAIVTLGHYLKKNI